jgi:rod shape-determining protein MreD
MGNSLYLAIPVMGLLAVIQTAILPQFPVAGVSPQLLFLVALAWGLLRGLREGLVWAFIAGIWVDLFSIAPVGVSSLAFMAALAATIPLQQVLPPRRLLSAILLAGLGTLVYLTLYLAALRAFGHTLTFNGLLELLPIFLLNLILIAPIYLILQMILRAFRPKALEL